MITIDLSGSEGNAFYLLSQAQTLAKQLDLDFDEINHDMTSGDYNHLLDVFELHFNQYVEFENDPREEL